MLYVSKEFHFEASHFLTTYHGKCEKLHGHSYRLRVTVLGDVSMNGLVLDFALLKRIVKRCVLDKLDHSHLNDTLENPSAERTCLWIYDQLKDMDTLLKEEIADPNLAAEIRSYLRTEDQGGQVFPEFSQVRLFEIRLWETPDSFVTYKAKL
ncbi:MAG: 6-carboxytetrahydropterin synthase QueD [Patescibacteria group bacterium]